MKQKINDEPLKVCPEDICDNISEGRGEVERIISKNVGLAIGAYERTLVTPSAFDKYLEGNIRAIDRKAIKGLKLL